MSLTDSRDELSRAEALQPKVTNLRAIAILFAIMIKKIIINVWGDAGY